MPNLCISWFSSDSQTKNISWFSSCACNAYINSPWLMCLFSTMKSNSSMQLSPPAWIMQSTRPPKRILWIISNPTIDTLLYELKQRELRAQPTSFLGCQQSSQFIKQTSLQRIQCRLPKHCQISRIYCRFNQPSI